MQESLEKFVNTVVEEKVFLFERGQLDFNYQELVDNEVVTIVGEEIQILDSPIFSEAFYTKLSSRLGITVNEDFNSIVEFYHTAYEYFREGNKSVSELRKQMKNLLNSLFIMTYTIEEDGKPLEDFVFSLKTSDNNVFIYEFSEAFSRNLHRLKIPIDRLRRILKHHYSQIESNDFGISRFMNGVESYCVVNPSEGKLLLEIFLE
ncbi:hypothetical protein [Tunicatimonas pelagia]|uniref:hypothetical protein n=1 Tax=Tunicatimonas pelagia TaxID=931531 RepID=UPI002666222E|nr:hypothetical protein [Tunicatimonas pelagia]WKN43784.1 hypothetical protein P0M28_02205 [Tunicatimonas pelagia]